LVNSYLQTSNPDIYALGDCAEINGQVLPFLQPIQLSAMYLAKNLLGGRAAEAAAMLVKVKTPECRCIWPAKRSAGSELAYHHRSPGYGRPRPER
jgi:nitric oxide reductase FlRd-NAD(+) reductase